jgi:hypothetical protein
MTKVSLEDLACPQCDEAGGDSHCPTCLGAGYLPRKDVPRYIAETRRYLEGLEYELAERRRLVADAPEQERAERRRWLEACEKERARHQRRLAKSEAFLADHP